MVLTEQLSYVLPSPKTEGEASVEKILANRRSRRQFRDAAMSIEQLSQILWAAYGVTNPKTPNLLRGGLRTTPSAGGLYPLEIYVAVGNVEGVEVGVYKYISQDHTIVRTIDKDIREELGEAAFGQGSIKCAPVTLVYCAIFGRTTGKYGARGNERYVFMEIGHFAQNVYLQAEALRLGACSIGAMLDEKICETLKPAAEEKPLCLMPVGYFYD